MVSTKHTLCLLGLPVFGAAAVVTSYVTIGCGNLTSGAASHQTPIPSSKFPFSNISSAAGSYPDSPASASTLSPLLPASISPEEGFTNSAQPSGDLAELDTVLNEEGAAVNGQCSPICNGHGGDQRIRLSGPGVTFSTSNELENGLEGQEGSLTTLDVGGSSESLANDQGFYSGQNIAEQIYRVEASDNPTIGPIPGISSVSYTGYTLSKSQSNLVSSNILSPSNSQSSKPSSVQSTTDNTLTSTSSGSQTPTPTPDTPWNHTVTAYFGSGETGIFPASKIPWKSITHLCYAFAKTQNASANWSVSVNESLLSTLSEGAQEHGVDLILSIGGYGEGGRYFSDLAHTNASINAFVASFKMMRQKYNLAGIDIDWEFVGGIPPEHGINRATDAAGYLNLLKALRKSMPDLQITAAVPVYVFAGPNGTTADMRPYVPYFTRLNLMLYDLWRGGETAGSNAPLGHDQPDDQATQDNAVVENQAGDLPYPNAGPNPDQDYCIAGVETWLEAGFPAEKLIFGVPFYGYGYLLEEGSDPSKTGLYSDIIRKSPGDDTQHPSKPKDNSGFWGWRNLKSQQVVVQSANGSYGPGPGWQQGYDALGQVPYVWSTDRGEIISYDDPQSLRIKYKWARDHGLGGMMFWVMNGDTDDTELTKVLN